MTDRTAERGSLELEAVDFGPIVNAKVELRPLTVFVGPSNTGKSYLAMLIYAFHRFLSVRQFPFRLNQDGSLTIGTGPTDTTSEGIVQVVAEFMRSIEESSVSPHRGTVSLSPAVANSVRSGFAARADVLADEIKRCFGIRDPRALVRKTRSSTAAHVTVRHRLVHESEPWEHAITIGRRTDLSVAIPAGASISADSGLAMPFNALDLLRDMSAESQGLPRSLAWSFIAAIVLRDAFGPFGLPAYYLPADRTGLMQAQRAVVGGLIASAPAASLQAQPRSPILSGVVADFLEQLLGIDETASKSALGTDIEQTILGGSVRIERSPSTNHTDFLYRPNGWREDLPLTNASSMTSEVAPVVLYLRHLVARDNVLIVEEPESHMHPAMQVKFMQELAAVVNAGVRVIVTTHSEWMTEELGNIVRRSGLPENDRDGPALDADQVGAWLFGDHKRSRGSIVREIPLDDDGQYPCGFDDVAAALHNDWAGITSRIEEQL